MAAALVAGLFTASQALAGPRANARYDGRDATHKRAFVAVSKDGRRVSQWGFATRIGCSDRKRHLVFFVSAGERPATVLSDGSFSRSSSSRRGAARMSGQFDQSGNTVTGIYNVVSRTRRYTCRTGDVTFTLHRDGTPGAPFRSGLVASGLYRASGRGLRLRMRPLLPGGFIHSFRVVYATRCSSGKVAPWELRLLVPLVKGSRFGVVVQARLRRKAGGSNTTRARIAGVFAYDNGYKLGGAVRARNVVHRPGARPDVCRATIPFKGAFKRGPLGEEGAHPAG